MSRILDDGDDHYAPLLERRVACDMLSVLFVRGFEPNESGRGTRPVLEAATDRDGYLIELLAIDDLRELQEQICVPGRYRVVAKDAVTKQIIASRDWLMRPRNDRRRPAVAAGKPAAAEAPAESSPAPSPPAGGSAKVEELLQRQVASLEKVNAGQQGTIETLQTALRDKSVEAAAASTQVAGLQARISELEDAREELRESLQTAQGELERLRNQLKDADFSPLDAIGQLDGALSLIKSTVKNFDE